MAGAALQSIARRMGAAEMIEANEKAAAAQRDSNRTGAIIGAIGNVAGAGLSAGIGQMNQGTDFGGFGDYSGLEIDSGTNYFSGDYDFSDFGGFGNAPKIDYGAGTKWNPDLDYNKAFSYSRPGF